MPRPKQSQLIALFGILLLVIGSSMFSYSMYLIAENQQTLNSTGITLDQLWNFESSINWWKNICITLILPLSSVFIVIGGITLSAQAILQGIKNKTITKTNLEKVNFYLNKNQTKIKIEKEKPLERG